MINILKSSLIYIKTIWSLCCIYALCKILPIIAYSLLSQDGGSHTKFYFTYFFPFVLSIIGMCSTVFIFWRNVHIIKTVYIFVIGGISFLISLFLIFLGISSLLDGCNQYSQILYPVLIILIYFFLFVFLDKIRRIYQSYNLLSCKRLLKIRLYFNQLKLLLLTYALLTIFIVWIDDNYSITYYNLKIAVLICQSNNIYQIFKILLRLFWKPPHKTSIIKL